MQKFKFLGIVLVVMLLTAAGCATQTPVPTTVPATEAPVAATEAPTVAPTEAPAETSITVTDALERTVTLPSVPQKIVIVGRSIFAIADAIYLFPEAGTNIFAMGPTVQGTGNFIPLIDPAFPDKISLAKSPTTEEIAALQPDLVIMKTTNAEEDGKPLEELQIPVVYVDFETAEQYQRDLVTLGQIFQNPERAETLAAYFQGKVDAVANAVGELTDEQKPRTLLLYYSDKDGVIAFKVPPAGWIQTYLVETAGGQPVWMDANPGDGWAEVNLEQIAAWNPDVIFLVSYFVPANDVVADMKADAAWQLLDAVKNDKLYAFATDVYSWDQPDPRWVLGLDWVAAKLHPDLFPQYDAIQDAKAFYLDLYGMDEAAYTANIEPLMTGDYK